MDWKWKRARSREDGVFMQRMSRQWESLRPVRPSPFTLWRQTVCTQWLHQHKGCWKGKSSKSLVFHPMLTSSERGLYSYKILTLITYERRLNSDGCLWFFPYFVLLQQSLSHRFVSDFSPCVLWWKSFWWICVVLTGEWYHFPVRAECSPPESQSTSSKNAKSFEF